MIHLTFPDGSVRDYQAGITGAELAASISKSLAKKAVAIASMASWPIWPTRSRKTAR